MNDRVSFYPSSLLRKRKAEEVLDSYPRLSVELEKFDTEAFIVPLSSFKKKLLDSFHLDPYFEELDNKEEHMFLDEQMRITDVHLPCNLLKEGTVGCFKGIIITNRNRKCFVQT